MEFEIMKPRRVDFKTLGSCTLLTVQCEGIMRGVIAVPVAPRLMSRLVTEEFIIGERCRAKRDKR